MYSMNYIGKFIANFREFYNEINGATLTGAIDVVVVEQPDGSFTCSPFHVRFGKLGVLRSRFKVVDLELNGEPLDIHMKLGESGEAFFVEEVGLEEGAGCAAHLATSPIPAPRFELFAPREPRRRNSLSAVEPDHGNASDYTKRRYTADGQTMQKPDLSKLTKDGARNDDKPADNNEAIFEMDDIESLDGKVPKTFAAAQLGEDGCAANQTVQQISASNDFRPIDALNEEDSKQNGGAKKKKKTRKLSSKKKHQRKASNSSMSSMSERAFDQMLAQPSADIHFFSDTEANLPTLNDELSNMKLDSEKRIPLALSDTAFEVPAAAKHAGSRGGTPVQSDTEAELARAVGQEKSRSWRWGELPAPASPPSPGSPAEPFSSDEERGGGVARGVLGGVLSFMARESEPTAQAPGVYLDDLDRGNVDAQLYFPKHHADQYRQDVGGGAEPRGAPTEEEYESGNGPSLPPSQPQSPTALHAADPPALDSDDDDIFAKGGVSVWSREYDSPLSFEALCSRGGELAARDALEVRLGARRMSWRTAGPMLVSLLAYRKPLPDHVLEALCKPPGAAAISAGVDAKPRGYSWWSWRRSTSAADDKRIENLTTAEANTKTDTEVESGAIEVKDVKIEEKVESDIQPLEEKLEESKEIHITTIEAKPEIKKELVVAEEIPAEIINKVDDTRDDSGEDDAQEDSTTDSEEDSQMERPSRRHSAFRKTLRLSSDQIKSLRLRDGMNEMVFSVTTALQGTTRCRCNIFRWRYDDKLVVSDIDGTITKSDVLGHIFPLVGKDWAQSGVAQLFTKIKNNGYQLLYLSARAIGQARVTREYLRSIRQGEVCLPDGPLLLNPTSLLRAFHREVIEKKPEEFKIQCLADIRALFPPNSNPFYAGYGNRVNDVCAYQAVGIPIVRIFTINYKGELKHELTQTFQSTYSHMSVLVDQVFPPCQCEPSDEFSHTMYWRDPIPDLDLSTAPHAAPH